MGSNLENSVISADNIQTIGVIGAGQMGSGIAHVSALAGYDVVLSDISEDQLDKAILSIRHNMERQLSRGKINDESYAAAISKISISANLGILSDADLVIESAVEDEKTKLDLYSKICPLLKPTALIASNTSSISITRLAAATDRPEKFVGMHFMNPVPMMELVEVIRGIATGHDTYACVTEIARRLGKSPASAEDFPAFIVNRILLPMINEAVYTLYEGVGTVEAIDNAMRLGAHHPMGPLQLADFIGLDTCLSVMQVLYEGLADSKYRPCPLLVKYVDAGWIGRKAGRGFYDYSSEPPKPTR